jgi:hypothetical protein
MDLLAKWVACFSTGPKTDMELAKHHAELAIQAEAAGNYAIALDNYRTAIRHANNELGLPDTQFPREKLLLECKEYQARIDVLAAILDPSSERGE